MLAFENPAAFLFLLVIPLLVLARRLGIFKRTAFPLVFADWGGKSFLWNRKLPSFIRILSSILFTGAFIALVIALSEPVMHSQEKVFTSKGADILFVLDTSPSMASRDIAGMTRLEAARQGIHTLVQSNRGAAFGLVAMASEAATIAPPTTDHALFLNRLDSLSAGGLGEGSAIGIGLSSAVYHLVSSDAPKKCIVLITDGENNAGSVHPDTAAELARQNEITLYVFGIGTRGSVPIEYIDPNTGKVHSGYYDSEFDTAPLESLALLAGGRYFGIGSVSALSDALSSVSRRENVVQSFYYKTADRHLYYYFLSLCAVLACLAWILRRVVLREVM